LLDSDDEEVADAAEEAIALAKERETSEFDFETTGGDEDEGRPGLGKLRAWRKPAGVPRSSPKTTLSLVERTKWRKPAGVEPQIRP
jgi:hypothetical protein